MKCIIVQHETPSINFDSIKFYGAVVNAWAHIYPDILEGLLESIRNGELRFSSPLPYWKGHLYMPFPKVSFKNAYKIAENEGYSRYPMLEFLKILRKARYLRADYISQVNGDLLPASLAREIYNEWQRFDEASVTDPPPFLNKSVLTDPRPHSTLRRTDNYSTIFFLEEEITPGYDEKHLFSQVILYTGAHEKEMRGALRFITDMGISKKSGWGLGKVRMRMQTIKDIELQDGFSKYRYLLSRYIPTEEEQKTIDPTHSRFEMGYLSGYRREGFPLPRIRYIAEGALLRSDEELIGRVIEEESWLLSGIGFFLGG